MSTENTTATEAPTTGGDDFTPEERAYLDTRGEAPLSGNQAPAPAPTGGEPAPDAAASDDDPEGTLTVDPEGRVRDKKSGKFVPHGLFHKEREGRKSAEQQLAELRVREARVNERLAILSQAFEGQDQGGQPALAAKPAPPPDPETDIFGYVKWLGERNAQLEAQLTTTKTETVGKLSEMEMGTAYRNDAIAFARETPDFGSAYQHLVQSIDAELQLMGVADPKQRMAEIARMEREQVTIARKGGKRPAEHIYALAKVRGWTAPAAASPQSKGGEVASQPAPASDAASAELDRLARGQNAARSLSSAGGGAPAALTAEVIAGMNETEFSALLSKTGNSPNAALRKLLGG